MCEILILIKLLGHSPSSLKYPLEVDVTIMLEPITSTTADSKGVFCSKLMIFPSNEVLQA